MARDKALETKTSKCNYQHLALEIKAGKHFVVKFSTAAYELEKSGILILLPSTDISTNYTVLEQHGIEHTNLMIDSCYKKENKNRQVICPKCETPDDNEGIACDSCDNWYHYICSYIKEDDLKLYEGSDFHCQQCNDDLLYIEQSNNQVEISDCLYE
ncbi:unnamed protein product [Mytilus coruscus]|uniref:PHD-type domain-containing protein n=1 Tax=Mytilus coruscus TaxID=42192 RepID=A0A6J8E6F5_MYTCO|nr:unnamed protein product [Mytilus coruscus]